MDNSETSDNRPYTASTIIFETSFEKDDHDISQLNPYHIQIFQNQESLQLNIVPDQHQDTTTFQNLPDFFDTLTVQNVSELSATNTKNPESFTLTIDSNVLQIPVRNVTQNTNNNQNQDNTSTLTTSNTTVTQPFQIQQPSPRNYGPFLLPPQFFAQTISHNSPQQGSSNTTGTSAFQVQPETQFQTTTPPRQPILQTLSYTPAQSTQTQNIQPGLTINTLHSNTLFNHITTRNLPRPPL